MTKETEACAPGALYGRWLNDLWNGPTGGLSAAAEALATEDFTGTGLAGRHWSVAPPRSPR